MAAWPGVQGMSGSGRMNHITPLFLAWAYILSAKWLELLNHSSGHSCKLQYSESTSAQITSKLDIGYEIDASENRWWNAVLSLGWKMTTNYEGRVYLSPWSVTASDSPFQGEEFQTIASNAASSQTALTYLNRFSMQHDLQDQYAAALAAALFIPSLGGSTLLLPRLAIPSRPRGSTRGCSGSFSDQGEFLPYYMTLSCIPFGMRSLLCSTFFNADIKCNLVSAWLGPCFAMIDPLIKDGDFTKLAALLGYRQPSVAALWVGAIIVGMAKSVIREMRIGLGALDLHAAAWTSTLQSFINVNPGKAEETTILREDECRLLFILGSGSHSRLPLFPWKPFGTTPLEEAEIEIKIHAKCNCHCLEHLSWHWELSNGTTLEDTGLNRTWKEKCDVDIGLNDCPKTYTIDQSELVSEISEIATRGIFGWLRPHGYPASESFIHEHPWFDIGSSEEEEADSDSDEEKDQQSINVRIENWMAEASIFDRKWR